MVSLRKAGAYSKKHARPYTRMSKVKSKSYIKTVPQKKIVKFNMGDIKGYNKKRFKTDLKVVSDEEVQIRDNAIEACRQSISRELEKQMPGQFYFEVCIYPHHILREHKMLTGAGADRMQSGMKHSFGKAGGRAAFVKPGQKIFLISTNTEKNINIAKQILNSIKAKLPCKAKITIEKIKES